MTKEQLADLYAQEKAYEYAQQLGIYIDDPIEQQAIEEVYKEAYEEYMRAVA